jgi:PKD repeat protein
LYIWNNTHYGTQISDVQLTKDNIELILQENRDYFLFEPAAYIPYVYPHSLRSNEPVISTSASSLVFETSINGNNPLDQSFQISNSGAGSLDWSISNNAGWLSCSPVSGIDDADVTISVNSQGLSADTYTATITISSNSAINSPQYINVTLTISASPTPPSASISASPTSGYNPLIVDFTSNITGGTPPISFTWDFGDGGTSDSQNPVHTYTQPGNYAALLTVIDDEGAM